MDAGTDACASLALASMVPQQGFDGIDVVVQIAGSGFAVCGGADGGACADHFTLKAPSCGDAGAPDAGDGGDAGPYCNPDGGDVTITLTTLRSDGNVVTAIVPEGAALGGPYTLVDDQNGCTATLSGAYTTLPASSSLTVSSITPSYGWTGADTPVTITGVGFVSTPTAYIRVPSLTPQWQKLKNVAFTSSTSITGVVPKGLPATPTGPKYSIAVLNPDGQGNVLGDAFRVVNQPPPTITSVSPSSLTTSQLGATNNVTITGCNFRSPGGTPLEIDTVDGAGTVVAQTAGTLSCAGAATCPGGTNVCTLPATIGAGLATGAYVVRVIDHDQETSGDYSALVVTNPSAKLDTGFAVSSNKLNVPRRSLVTTSARIDEASRFLYAIGGEKADNTVLDSVEVAPLDKFGTLGAWFVQKYKLSVPRSGASVVQLGQYLYVLGGTSTFVTSSGTGGAAPTGTPLATIDRAKILDATDIPTLGDPTTKSTGTLAAGSWYYRVSAVRDATDPDNKNGETLASDEIVAALGFKGSVVLTWTAPTNSAHIAKYRVFRTPTVNGKSGEEVFLAEVTAATTYTDDGSATAASDTPLPRGSTGTWNALTGTLVRARLNAGATIAKDSAGGAYVEVVGGWGKCDGLGSNRLMNCYEYATITADGKTVGAFTAGTNALNGARMRHGTTRMGADNGIAGWTGGAFVVVAGGAGPTNPNDSVEWADVKTGGALDTWTKQGNPSSARDGEALMAANGFFYQFGGALTLPTYVTSNDLASVSAETATTLTIGAWSNANSALNTGRGRMGATLESAYFYLVGGTSDDSGVLDSVEQIIY